ncbi:sigma-70 family RNA polymerase sigma factor [Pseudomonas sp. ABC1]|uniref:sigma-70 family RNA polymerase sigma factor n=1 Tax=Pseudomonas sp. ABC1 TaxID=2748080 RepID=UPI001C4E1C56|nr:sigma-70 family RNA polymerase sigma factor [Pseudomonas sp. ABC1]
MSAPLLLRQRIRTLYSEHHCWLSGWLRRKLGCPHAAADASHDTFLKLLAFEELPTLREPRAYLLVTANRLLINQYRRRRVEEETLRSMAILLEDQDQAGPEHLYATRHLLERVLLMLCEELDEKPRRAFLMARVDGLSYAQIAEQLGVSTSSVKQYLAKALAHCHARLLPEASSDV